MITIRVNKDNSVQFINDPNTGSWLESEKVTLENIDKKDLAMRLSVALNQIINFNGE